MKGRDEDMTLMGRSNVAGRVKHTQTYDSDSAVQ